jgi:hypothetical protein
MNARMVKETRDLLPALAVTVLFIVVPYAIWGTEAQGFGFGAFALGALIMGGNSFGEEFHHRTISLLLAQPLPRPVVWREKMLILVGAILLSLAALWVCLELFFPESLRGVDALWGFGLISLCAFCGAPYCTLLFKNGIAGIVFALAIPGLLAAIGFGFVGNYLLHDEQAGVYCTISLLLGYCGLACWRSFARFKRLQLVDGPSLELSLPANIEAGLEGPLKKLGATWVGPLASLVKKELRLQQICFVAAALFCLIAFTAGFWGLDHQSGGSLLVTDAMLYCVLLPFLAGSIAASDERRWGVLEWHLTLPPSKVKQWSAKLVVVYATYLILGLILPVLMFVALRYLFGFIEISSVLLAVMVPIQLLLLTLSLYTGTFSNSALRTILLAFAMLLAMLSCARAGMLLAGKEVFEGIVRVTPRLQLEHFFWQWLATLGWLLVLLAVILRFAFSNYRRNELPVRRLVGQVLLLLLLSWLSPILIAATFLAAG